jgi:hypothetical protein
VPGQKLMGLSAFAGRHRNHLFRKFHLRGRAQAERGVSRPAVFKLAPVEALFLRLAAARLQRPTQPLR